MIYMIGGLIVGTLLGVLVVWFVPKNALGWVVLGLGAVALAFLLPGLVAILIIPFDATFFSLFSIPLSVASVVAGVGAVLKKHRTWQVWLGLGLGFIPFLFWVVVAIGDILFPH